MKAYRKSPATLADLDAVPETMIGELIGGELIATPRPANPHAVAATALVGELYGPFQRGRGGPGGWLIVIEPEIRLSGNVYVPDVTGWRRARMPSVPDAPHFVLAPDWVCEVLSKSTSRTDRMLKLPAYLREKVGHVWLVDPQLKAVEAFRNDGVQWVLEGTHAGGARVRLPPFEALELDLGALWSDEDGEAEV